MGWLDITLTVCVLLALAQGNKPMMRTAAALLGCLIVNRLHFLFTHEYVPYGWYIIVDTITAAIVLARPAGRVQAMIGTTYLAEISFHVAYAVYLHRNGFQYATELCYWKLLFWTAMLQAAMIVGWTGSGLARLLPVRWPLFHRGVSASPNRSRVA